MLANWITAKQQPASMYHSVKGTWIHESINGWILDHWKPARCSGPFRLHQAPSGFEDPCTSAPTHPQSTLHRPSRIATLVRTALGLVVRCYEGPLPSYMPTVVEVGWADGMQAHTLLWHRPCWLVCAEAGNYNVHRPVLSRHETGTIRVVTAPIGRSIAAPIRQGTSLRGNPQRS